jgi:septum site-determining protein MinD
MGKAIGILSLKGGVGKTSITASLGDALSSFGKRVLLIDGNFSAPNLGVHFNLINPQITVQDILARKSNVKDAIYHLEKFDVMPASIFYNIEINYLDLRKRIKDLKKVYDFIILDSSPSLNDETLAVMMASDELLVVTTPDYLTLSSTIKSVKDAKQRGIKISGIILNKVYGKNFELSIEDIEKTLGLPVMAKIPHDKNILKSVSEFVSSVSYKPKSSASSEILKLAASLSGSKYNPFKIGNLFKITPSRTDINRILFYERVF